MPIFMLAIFLLAFSSYACNEDFKFYPEDCRFQDRTKNIEEGFRALGIDYKQIATHRALRFIDRGSWEKYLKYLPTKSPVKPWTVYKPSPYTWIYWERGMWRADRLKNDLEKRELTLLDLQNLHRSSIISDLMTWTSVYLKAANPGELRSGVFKRPPEFWIKCEWGIGEEGKNLVMNYDLKDSNQHPLLKGSIKLCQDGVHFSGHVVYLESQKVIPAISSWVSSFNDWLREIKSGAIETSPIEQVADFQRHFVAIHPFGDGNGRLSRFIQDIQLDLLGIAAPFSADLKDDLLTPKLQYRQNFKRAIDSSLSFLEKCLEQHKSQEIEAGCQVVTTNFSEMIE